MGDNIRELGTITSTRFGPEPDRGFNVCEIFIDFDGGAQGFVFGIGEKKNAKKIREEICDLFGVKDEKFLKGQRCYALRCFDTYNEVIEGIETMSGRRFTRTGWGRRMGFKQKGVLEERRESTVAHIESLKRRVAELTQTLNIIDESYVHWEEQ
jgi:hypothetical protein